MDSMEQKLSGICRKYNIRDLYVFGSRAAEISAMVCNQPAPARRPESDVDIGVLPASINEWDPEKKVDLAIELQDLFGVGRIDLVFLPEADAFVAVDIIRGELLFTSDPDQQARYELFVLRRAGDLLPFKKARTRMILEEGGR